MDSLVDQYLKSSLFSKTDNIIYEEIGDGNINHVYRAISIETNQSIILKMANVESRISSQIRLSVSRGKREAEYFKYYRNVLPNNLPEIYDYNEDLHLIVMQDLSNSYEVLRKALMNQKQFLHLGNQLADYLSRTAIYSSRSNLNSNHKNKLQSMFYNPELCSLTERLVFSDPFILNTEFTPSKNITAIKKTIASDNYLLNIVEKMKKKFINEKQALIHGDFHLGSIFVNENNIIVFDPEFCFLGPIGFDLGNVFAHLLMEIYYCRFINNDSKEYINWLKSVLKDLFTSFEKEYSYALISPQPTLNNIRSCNSFVSSILSDSAGFAGIECLRRTVGIARIPEYDNLSDSNRCEMECMVSATSINLMKNMNSFQSSKDFIQFINQV